MIAELSPNFIENVCPGCKVSWMMQVHISFRNSMQFEYLFDVNVVCSTSEEVYFLPLFHRTACLFFLHLLFFRTVVSRMDGKFSR